MKIVIDTNVLLVSISRKSKYNWIFQKILTGKVDICISNEILFEYSEKIGEIFSPSVAFNTLRVLQNLPNTVEVKIYYNWDLIKNDPSDNKFTDCYIASRADYILTEDSDFNVLQQISFPIVKAININQFEEIFKTK